MAYPSKLSLQDKKDIALRYGDGEKAYSLADEYGVVPVVIYRVLKEFRVPVRNRISEAERLEIAQAYLSGQSLASMSKDTGRSTPACSAVVKSLNIAIREHRTHTIDASYFSRIDTAEKAWLLGFALADVSIDEGSKFSFGLAVRDEDVLHRIKDALGSTAPVSIGWGKDQNGKRHRKARLTICCKRLVGDLIRYGVTGRKSHTAVPWTPPAPLAAAYWRGVWDGDGWLFRNGAGWGRASNRGNWRFGLCGTEAVVQGFAAYVAQVTGRTEPVCKDSRKSLWFVNYYGLALLKSFLPHFWPDATIYIDRKKALLDAVAADEPLQRDWSWLTNERIEEMRKELGLWSNVAAALGTTDVQLCKLRIRRGMARRSMSPRKP